MELRQLEYFCQAAKFEHITKAAEALFISPPALSRSVSSLEQELGVPLFDTQGRGIKLNPNGTYFYSVVSRVLEDLRNAKTELAERNALPSAAVTVINELPDIFPHVIRSFCNHNPKVPIFEAHMGNSVSDLLRSNDVSFLLSYRPPDSGGIASSVLLQDQLHLIVPCKHRLASRCSVSLPELRDEPFVAYAGLQTPKAVEAHLQYPEYLVSDLMTIIHLIQQENGIAVIPALNWRLLQPDLNRGFSEADRPRAIPISDAAASVPIYIAWAENKWLSPNEQTFLTFSQKFFQKIMHEDSMDE